MEAEKEAPAATAASVAASTTPSISNGTSPSDATLSTSKSTSSSTSSSSSPSPVWLRTVPPPSSSPFDSPALSLSLSASSNNHNSAVRNPYSSQKRGRKTIVPGSAMAGAQPHSQSSEASTSPCRPRPLAALRAGNNPTRTKKRPATTAPRLDDDDDDEFDNRAAAIKRTAVRPLVQHRNPYAATHKKQTTTTTKPRPTPIRSASSSASSSRPPPTKIWRPGERDAWEGKPSDRLPPSDRFFAALLRSSPAEYRQCGSSGSGSGSFGGSGGGALWHTLCTRLSLPVPDRPPAPRCARPTFDDNDDDDTAKLPPKWTEDCKNISNRNCTTMKSTIKSTLDEAAVTTPWPAVDTIVPPSPSVDHHFAVRAALVVEEARYAISQGLCGGRGGGGGGNKGSSTPSMLLVTDRVEVSTTLGHVRIVFRKPFQLFTRDELAALRPGTVVEVTSRDARAKISSGSTGMSSAPAIHSALGFVVTANRDQLESQRQFSILAFVPLDIREGGEWKVSIVANCITESRCYEALVNPHLRRSTLLPSLLGWGNPPTTPTTNTTMQEKAKQTAQEVTKATTAATSTPSIRTFFQHKKGAKDDGDATASSAPSSSVLNATQELASASFLDAPPGTVAIVQGPPGTGKTTLLVTVIRRYLEQPPNPMPSAGNMPPNRHNAGRPTRDYRDRRRGGDYSSTPTLAPRPRRLLVCAPTNKAVSVLATRFVQSLESASHSPTSIAAPINVVLVGDADKLLEGAGKSSPLRRVFLYTWMEAIADEYRKLRNAFLPGSNSRGTLSMHDLLHTARTLQARLLSNLEGLQAELVTATAQVTEALQGLTKKGAAAPAKDAIPTGWSALGQHQIVPKIEKLLKLLSNVPNDHVWRQVLNNAHVVFCTLVCAGGAVFKNTRPVDDCIVDEAAAASEPEVCIPLHLRPSRVLLVGDPLQLPATILSQTAGTLGLGKSLQERLMIDCRYPHVMLDVQYRMKPDICQFPSRRFYQSRLLNGSNVIQESYGRHSRRVLGGRPYTFVQVAGVEEQGAGGSYRNPAEAQVVLDLLQQLKPADNSCKDWQSPNRIRVITYYQAQVGLLQRLFRQHSLSVVVATVDSSQGCEADIVLVSLVRSSPSVGFLDDDRRLNVSLTRARHQLVCVGHARQLQTCSSETVRLLARDAHDRGCVVPYPSPHDPNGRGTVATNRGPPCRVTGFWDGGSPSL